MKEKDLQNYLYHNPDILFPDGHVQEKAREYYIEGKRIDLLFRVGGVRHIVELKAVPLEREHIGQVVEYYGLMKEYLHEADLKMILVAPSILSSRKIYLEELGIRCVEIDKVPDTPQELAPIKKQLGSYQKREQEDEERALSLRPDDRLTFEEITGDVSHRSLALTHKILRDTLEPVQKKYSDHDVVPYRIRAAISHDVDCEGILPLNTGQSVISNGRVWWAYSFGKSVNDIPNISCIAYPAGLNISINSEIKASQQVFLNRIKADPDRFDRLLSNHGNLMLTTHLKIEHQPRIYHWIPFEQLQPGTFDGRGILSLYQDHQHNFSEQRDYWIERIQNLSQNLTEGQSSHMRRTNKTLNLALRLVRLLDEDDSFWSKEYTKQKTSILNEVNELKPLVDFFVK